MTDAAPGVDPGGAVSGIRGVTVLEQGRPLLRDEPAPVEPMPARIRITRGGLRIAQVETNVDGRFQVLLPPGTYLLTAENLTGAPVPTAFPVTVHIHAHELQNVTIQFDSGIR